MSWLNENESHSIEAIALHLMAEMPEWDGICPGLRESAASAPTVSQADFVAAAMSIGINKATASIQFRKQRAFQAGCDAAEKDGTIDAFLKNHKW